MIVFNNSSAHFCNLRYGCIDKDAEAGCGGMKFPDALNCIVSSGHQCKRKPIQSCMQACREQRTGVLGCQLVVMIPLHDSTHGWHGEIPGCLPIASHAQREYGESPDLIHDLI